MDPKVNGQIQRDWGWLVAAYLFLGGVGSGAYVTAIVNSYVVGGSPLSTSVGLWVSWTAVLVGTFCLLADLGAPFRAILAGMKPGTSWIARGFWVISIFMIVAFVQMVAMLYTDVTRSSPALNTVLSTVGVILAIFTMGYTGILLGAAKGIPFWRSGVVPVVFVISALATGHFTVMIGVAFVTGTFETPELRVMAAEAAVLIMFELLAIFFFLQAAYRLPDAKESALRLLRRTAFVTGYFILGLAVPLVLMATLYWSARTPVTSSDFTVATLGAVLGLIGGLILRQSVLAVGALPTWNMAGFKFRRIARPKEPKPEIGLMPPS